MDADGLVRAIRAALDETERKTRAATCEAWVVQLDTFNEAEVVTAEAHSRYAGDKDPEPYYVVSHGDFHTAVSAEDAEHIAHNDPAAVLRRVAADRELLALYEFVTGHGPAVDHVRAMDMTTAAAHALLDAIKILARRLGINPETETPQ